MNHYLTFYKEHKSKILITNKLKFLETLGESGVLNNTLTAFKDRHTVYAKLNPKLYDEIIEKRSLKWHINYIKKFITNELNNEFLYHEFKIPKTSGGYRIIHSPNPKLKTLQYHIKYLIENLNVLTHDAAHGCVPTRSSYTNARYHQQSNHFARVDFKDFFPSITSEFLLEVLPQIGPFATSNYNKEMKLLIELIVQVATYNGKLPQGSPISPLLANLALIPFDFHMRETLKEMKPTIIYTRYVDDMTFSSFYTFNNQKKESKETLHNLIENVMITAYQKKPLTIKTQKTMITTKFGKNRVTGVKINQENKLSIGYKEKRELKRELASLIIQRKKGLTPDKNQVQHTLGLLSYLNNIEPNYKYYIVNTLKRKFNIKIDLYQYLFNL